MGCHEIEITTITKKPKLMTKRYEQAGRIGVTW